MLGNVICVHMLWNSVACRFVHFLSKLSYIVSLSYSLKSSAIFMCAESGAIKNKLF